MGKWESKKLENLPKNSYFCSLQFWKEKSKIYYYKFAKVIFINLRKRSKECHY